MRPPFLRQIHSGIEYFIHYIRYKHKDDYECSQKNGGSHNQCIVAVCNAGNEMFAQSRHGKDLFNNKAAGKDVCDHRTGIGDDRCHGVSQRVLENNFIRFNAFGAGGADIILSENVEHARAGKSGYIGHRIQAERDNGKHQACKSIILFR